MTWSEKPLDALGSVSRGRSRHRPRDAAHLYGGSYPFVQTGDVKHAGLYLRDYSQTYSDAGLAQSKLWPRGTLCITIAANIAETSILDIEACFPDSVIGFIPDPDKADARFVKYLFDALLKKKYRSFSQGVAQDNLSQEKLLSIQLPVPELPDQRRIADILSAYDDLIENNRRRIALLEQAASELYREWFVRLRFPGHEHVQIVDGVPEGWQRSSLGALVSYLKRGITPSYDEEGDSIVINQKCIRSRMLSLANARRQNKVYKAEKGLRAGDILINSTGAGTLGRVAQVWDALERTTVDSHVTIVRPSEDVFAHWLGFAVMAQESLIQTLGEGATNQTELNPQRIAALSVLRPSATVGEAFEQFALNVVRQILNLQKQSEHLASARDLLLPRLMNGSIAV